MALDLAWLLVVLPLAAFALIVLLGRGLPGQGAIMGVIVAGIGLALLVLLVLTFQREGAGVFEVAWLAWAGFSIPLGMQVDALTLVMLGIVISVSFLVQVYSLGYMAGEHFLRSSSTN